jgi:hypothetical protein
MSSLGYGVERESLDNRIRLAAMEYKKYPGNSMDKGTLDSLLGRYGLEAELSSFHKYLIEQKIVNSPTPTHPMIDRIKRLFGYK